MDDGSIEGRADRILRQLMNEGDFEQVIEIVGALAGNEGHDISVAFRACLIAQGFEVDAMYASEVKLFLHKNGFMLQIDPRGDDDWFENKSPELDKAFSQAIVWIMRGANIDAYIDEEGRINNRGPILPTTKEDVEHIVGQFREELDEQFPDTPPQREREVVVMDLLDKMRSSPDRGTPCQWCETPSKDCQIGFIETLHRCCDSCDERGGEESHPGTLGWGQ